MYSDDGIYRVGGQGRKVVQKLKEGDTIGILVDSKLHMMCLIHEGVFEQTQWVG